VVSGQWDFIYRSLFVDYNGNSWLSNIILLLIIGGAVVAVVGPTVKKKSKDN